MSPSIDSRENRELADEMKFVVPPPIGEQIRTWARARLEADPHGGGGLGDEYRITSLYFDTERFDVFRRNGSYGRSKFRIRKYGASEQVFLERKLKTHGLVSKRRSLVPSDQLALLFRESSDLKWRGAWYHRRLLLRRLRPVCQVSYDRTARVASTPHGPIRLTIDQHLEAVGLESIGFVTERGTPVSTEYLIVELKFRAVLPALFKALVQEFALTPAAVSKYRLSVAKLGLAPAEILDSAARPAKTAVYA